VNLEVLRTNDCFQSNSKQKNNHSIEAPTKKNMNRRLSAVFLISNLLNILLFAIFPKAIHRHDIALSLIGSVFVFAIVAYKLKRLRQQQDVHLNRSEKFLKLSQMFEFSLVIATLVLPWWAIIRESLLGERGNVVYYMLSPHLFLFQAQIALECIILMLPEGVRDGLLFRYTVAANCYRGIAIYRWTAKRFWLFLDEADADILLTILPCLAVGLWVCSNLFSALIWYPLLNRKQKIV